MKKDKLPNCPFKIIFPEGQNSFSERCFRRPFSVSIRLTGNDEQVTEFTRDKSVRILNIILTDGQIRFNEKGNNTATFNGLLCGVAGVDGLFVKFTAHLEAMKGSLEKRL